MWCKYKAIFPVGKIALDAVGGYGRRCSIWTERAGNKLSVLIGKERKTRILPGQGRTFVSVKQSLHFGETEALFRANKGSILFQIEYLFEYSILFLFSFFDSLLFHPLFFPLHPSISSSSPSIPIAKFKTQLFPDTVLFIGFLFWIGDGKTDEPDWMLLKFDTFKQFFCKRKYTVQGC